MARWFKGKEGGKAPPGAQTIQIALKFGVLPHQVEQMPAYWFNRIAIWMDAEADAEKMS